ncbi:hypothetical protein HPB51_014834 [Rhipicephalus microplus]|uniref:Cytochrome n=1 Tax=Rhipicephalus microplus TaxID=6941 RepID=A0A9J6DNI2_RHIMP|nr:hypothetical protein HPB51_014834 [Rhipicephalus microplus]
MCFAEFASSPPRYSVRRAIYRHAANENIIGPSPPTARFAAFAQLKYSCTVPEVWPLKEIIVVRRQVTKRTAIYTDSRATARAFMTGVTFFERKYRETKLVRFPEDMVGSEESADKQRGPVERKGKALQELFHQRSPGKLHACFQPEWRSSGEMHRNTGSRVIGRTNRLLQKHSELRSRHNRPLTYLITIRYFRPWLWIQAIYDSTHEGKFWKRTVDNIGELHRSVMEKRKSAIIKKLADESYDFDLDDELSFPAALDAAIKKHISAQSSYTMDELEKDTTSVTFAAADSTSAAMSWTLYLLGLNPDKQAKLQKELDDAFGRDGQHEITASDLKQLPYLECCIKESLRLCPPFPLIGRELDEELVIDGYTVPAGTTCMINIHSLHRNKEQFPEPESYIPERFLPENCKNMHPFSFIPFSSGVRVCLGQKFVMVEAKVLLAKLLSKFTVEAALPIEDVVPAYEVVLKANGGLRVWFRKRSDSS